jgi:hypothetical protein
MNFSVCFIFKTIQYISTKFYTSDLKQKVGKCMNLILVHINRIKPLLHMMLKSNIIKIIRNGSSYQNQYMTLNINLTKKCGTHNYNSKHFLMWHTYITKYKEHVTYVSMKCNIQTAD